MVYRMFVATLALGVCACGAAAPTSGPEASRTMTYEVSVDPGLSSILPEVVAASDSWQTAVPGLTLNVAVQTCTLSPDEICLVAASGDDCGGTDGADGSLLGCERPQTWGGSAIGIFLGALTARGAGVPQFFALEVQTTVAHELGHALGAVHIGAGNLMAPIISETSETPTAADVADFWSDSL